jgi:hypothetical protein
MEVEENHIVTIKMTYEECRDLAKEIDLVGFMHTDRGEDPITKTPMLTKLWNILP